MDRPTVEIFRTYQQCLWLYGKLSECYVDTLLPPFPERPNAQDTDYMEKKRLQMERFMVKLFARREMCHQSKDVSYFLSESMVGLYSCGGNLPPPFLSPGANQR